tara:strand:- start:1418 stop:2056 length:639 start_codon:yes stop_codon:yes gene_type:complete
MAFLIGERSNFIKIFIISYLFMIFIINTKFLNKILILLLPILILVFLISTNQNIKDKYYTEFINPIIKKDIDSQNITLKYFRHYNSALEIFYDNKIFGVGIKNYRNESGLRFHNKQTIHHFSNHPHQVHFEILSELGIIGYIIFFIFFIYMLREGLKIYKKTKNLETLSSILFIFATFLPLIPSGSFFTTYGATIFWINFSLLIKKNYSNKT